MICLFARDVHILGRILETPTPLGKIDEEFMRQSIQAYTQRCSVHLRDPAAGAHRARLRLLPVIMEEAQLLRENPVLDLDAIN